MQLFSINSNVFQSTLVNEYDDFKGNLLLSGDVKEDTRNYVDGNILFSIPQQSGAFNNLLTDQWNPTTLSKVAMTGSFRGGEIYLDDITDTIIKSEKAYLFKESIQQVAEIVDALGDKLAGILLVSGKTIINPLHPLAALVLIDERATLHYDTFKIVTYLYKDRKHLESIFQSDTADVDKIKASILSLISMYSNKQKINKVTKTLEVEKTNENLTLAPIRRFYRESIYKGNTYEGDFVVIPHQLLTKGIVAPYYGTSIILREDSTAKGAFITPFQSANISASTNEQDNPEFSSICTGETPKTTIEGLRTLSHANLSSPLNSRCVGAGAIVYADECIKQSINLYNLGGFINEPAKQPKEFDNAATIRPNESEKADLEHEFEQAREITNNRTFEGNLAFLERISTGVDFAEGTDETTREVFTTSTVTEGVPIISPAFRRQTMLSITETAEVNPEDEREENEIVAISEPLEEEYFPDSAIEEREVWRLEDPSEPTEAETTTEETNL